MITQPVRRQIFCQLGIWGIVAGVWVGIGGVTGRAIAQIVPDNTLPVNSQVTQSGTVQTIDGGTVLGTNLFHSFSSFSLATGQEAFFNNAANVSAIFARITGNQPSAIDGLLRANGTANLFLMNPNGITFGANARLNLGGSFLATTADRILFNDGSQFSANPAQTSPLLTINVPIGLGFDRPPAAITVQGTGQPLSFDPEQLMPEELADLPAARPGWTALNNSLQSRVAHLQVNDGQSLTLVGGDLNLSGAGLQAANGQISLGSLASPGTLALSNDLRLQTTSPFPTLGQIRLSQQAAVNTSGVGGGAIQLVGDRITLQDQSALVATTLGNQAGRGISIQSNQLTVSQQSLISTGSFGSGASGSILLQTGNLAAENQALISTVNLAAGRAGDLNITTTGEVSLGDRALLTTSPLDSGGDGGILSVNARALTLNTGARAVTSTFGSGQAGELVINTTGDVQILGTSPNNLVPSSLSARTYGAGDAAGVRINADRFIMRAGGQISTTTLGSGQGGRITINALDSVEIAGRGVRRRSGLFSQVGLEGTGPGGAIDITTQTMSVTDGAFISVATEGLGQGGNLNLRVAGSLELAGTDRVGVPTLLIAETYGPGTAGNVSIQAGQLALRGGAQISASSLGDGPGGRLSVEADRIEVIGVSEDGISKSGFYTASGIEGFDFEARGDGGNLFIQTRDLTLQDGGQISASTLGIGKGGTLSITADQITLQGIAPDGTPSLIFVETKGEAPAGDLLINTGQLRVLGGGSISAATSGQGAGGRLTIQASDRVEVAGSSPTTEVSNVSLPFSRPEVGANLVISNLRTDTLGAGSAGDLNLQTPNLYVADGGTIAVRSTGTGASGSLRITAQTINLANQGALLATTASGEGGNINLAVQDYILLRNNALISAEARGTGNGGNLDLQSNFIVAVLPENSDIIANAFAGNGGQIDLTTRGIFGLKITRGPLDPQISEINASSRTGIEGTVSIAALAIDPVSALEALPTEVSDSSNQIANTCGVAQNNSFTITGRGGLPDDPTQPIRGQTLWQDWQNFAEAPAGVPISDLKSSSPPPIVARSAVPVPAIGWTIEAKGQVRLLAPADRQGFSVAQLANCAAQLKMKGEVDGTEVSGGHPR